MTTSSGRESGRVAGIASAGRACGIRAIDGLVSSPAWVGWLHNDHVWSAQFAHDDRATVKWNMLFRYGKGATTCVLEVSGDRPTPVEVPKSEQR